MNIRGLPFLCAFALFVLGFQFLALSLNPMVLATGYFDEVSRLISADPVQSPLVAWLIENRGGDGRGMMFSSLLFALLWSPALLWVALSRFRGWMRYALVGIFLVMVTGFVYDPRSGGFAPVFHEVRWGWGLSILALSMGILRGRTKTVGKVADIVVLTLIFATLAVLNILFVFALLPAITLGFYCNKRLKTLVIAYGSSVVILLVFAASSMVGIIGDVLGNIQFNSPFIVDNILATLCLVWMPLMVFQTQKKCEAVLATCISTGLLVLMMTLPVSQPYWALFIAILLGIQSRGVVIYNRWGWKMKPSLRMLAVVFLVLGISTFYASTVSLVLHVLHDPAGFETLSQIADVRVLR